MALLSLFRACIKPLVSGDQYGVVCYGYKLMIMRVYLRATQMIGGDLPGNHGSIDY